jgi:hypothetical protein
LNGQLWWMMHKTLTSLLWNGWMKINQISDFYRPNLKKSWLVVIGRDSRGFQYFSFSFCVLT